MDREEPFHCTVDPLEKPDPSTVILNAGPAAATWFGEIELTFAVQPARTSAMVGGTSKTDGPARHLHPPRFAVDTCRADICNSLHYILVSSPRGRSPGRGQSSVAPPSPRGKCRRFGVCEGGDIVRLGVIVFVREPKAARQRTGFYGLGLLAVVRFQGQVAPRMRRRYGFSNVPSQRH